MYTQSDLSLFSPKSTQRADIIVTHNVIPTSIEHYYENHEHGTAIRNALYIKKYESYSNGQEQNPVVFFHGGPGIVNEEQFSIMQNYFTKLGHAFYIPEVEGSGMYSRGTLPKGLDSTMISTDLKLLELKKYNQSGLNEFTKNYVDDIKDVLDYVSKQHLGKKINVITHSLGGHQVLRALQQAPELNDKIEAICNVAGTSDVGANRFWCTLNQVLTGGVNSSNLFYCLLEEAHIRFLKSLANENQTGPVIDQNTNPSVNQQMNEELSVIYGDVSHFPPILFLHATDDKSVFFQGSVLLQNKIQEHGKIVQGFYFAKGDHQFIKNEGNPEIRNVALEKMNEFFQQPTKELSNDLSQLSYEDVMSEHSLFLQNKDTYLSNKFPEEELLDSMTI